MENSFMSLNHRRHYKRFLINIFSYRFLYSRIKELNEKEVVFDILSIKSSPIYVRAINAKSLSGYYYSAHIYPRTRDFAPRNLPPSTHLKLIDHFNDYYYYELISFSYSDFLTSIKIIIKEL